MNNKKNLILVPFKNLSKLKLKNSIFLGDWCRRYSPFEKIKSEPYHWSNYNKIEKDNAKIIRKATLSFFFKKSTQKNVPISFRVLF